jgi:hypothetical protein
MADTLRAVRWWRLVKRRRSGHETYRSNIIYRTPFCDTYHTLSLRLYVFFLLPTDFARLCILKSRWQIHTRTERERERDALWSKEGQQAIDCLLPYRQGSSAIIKQHLLIEQARLLSSLLPSFCVCVSVCVCVTVQFPFL